LKRYGPIEETGYYFPGQAIMEFLDNLPRTKRYCDVVAQIEDRILIMTHDDRLDMRLVEHEKKFGIRSTFFLLSYLMDAKPSLYEGLDIQLHFDKAYSTIERQVAEFQSKSERKPIMNRTHRLYWRSDFIDLAFLALNEFVLDCTMVGFTPYKLCVKGRILPIWEVPVSISDEPSDGRLISSWNPAYDVEQLFAHDVKPIVASCHPRSTLEERNLQTNFERICELKERYDYESLTMTEFYERYLEKVLNSSGPDKSRECPSRVKRS